MKRKATGNQRKIVAKEKKWQVFFQNLPVPLRKTESTHPTTETALYIWETGQMLPIILDTFWKIKYKAQKMPVLLILPMTPLQVWEGKSGNNGKTLLYTLPWWDRAAMPDSRRWHSHHGLVLGAPWSCAGKRRPASGGASLKLLSAKRRWSHGSLWVPLTYFLRNSSIKGYSEKHTDCIVHMITITYLSTVNRNDDPTAAAAL